MKVIDTHCDVLLKLAEDPTKRFEHDQHIQANLQNLQAGHVRVQFFAIFIDPDIKQESKFQQALVQVQAFYEKVIKPHPQMKHIKKWEDIQTLQDGEIGAILALEGLDAIGNDETKLSILYQLGVLSVGVTWNDANLCADGVGEERGAGLTRLGKRMIVKNDQENIITDVSHLSEKGFWDVLELTDKVIASHSNAKKICPHPRNLSDEQIKAIVQKGGFIGIVLYPIFITGTNHATVHDLVRHLEHFCKLGASKHIGIGSDFDGIFTFIDGIDSSSKFLDLFDQLEAYFSEDFIKGLTEENFLSYLKRHHLS
ncbi:diguanylate cyclase [Alkalihalobacillus pseudalcaliphilus]|nr:dipeptidase [Alkalihalobacillus pseudalcaliphilus]KMK76719.1 diguanylate cyclase [Alkalihalobacillus pseudalcaliphilus]